MAMKKKGMIFTLLAVIIISILLFFILMRAEYKQSDKMQVVSSRIDTVNSFVLDVKEDLQRATYISGFRAIMSMEEYIVNTEDYIEDAEAAFNESIFHETINGERMSFMAGSTMDDWIERIKLQGNKVGVIVDIYDEEVSISQSDPWYVDVWLNVTIEATDEKGTATWKTRSLLLTQIPIDRFEDPIYAIETSARVLNSINMTPYEGDYSGSNLYNHVEYSFYTAHDDAPNFLQRLEGDLTADPNGNGIESFVNLERFNDVGLSICYTCSFVDHMYFRGISGDGGYGGMQPWFKIDSPIHTTKYGL